MKNNLEEGDIEEALRAANAIGDDRLQQESTGQVVPDSNTWLCRLVPFVPVASVCALAGSTRLRGVQPWPVWARRARPGAGTGQGGDFGLARAVARDGGGRVDDLEEEQLLIRPAPGNNGPGSDDLMYVPRLQRDAGRRGARLRRRRRHAQLVTVGADGLPTPPCCRCSARGHAGGALRPGQPAVAPHRRRSPPRWRWSPVRMPTSARRSTPPRPSTAGSCRPGTTRRSTCAARCGSSTTPSGCAASSAS